MVKQQILPREERVIGVSSDARTTTTSDDYLDDNKYSKQQKKHGFFIAFLKVLLLAIVARTLTTLIASSSSSPRHLQGSPRETAVHVEKTKMLPHDDPRHIWHWTRENSPSPILGQRRDCSGDIGVLYSDLYTQFHNEGYVIFESCSLKANQPILKGAARFTKTMKEDRLQSAKRKVVIDISIDPDTLELLEYLHGGSRRVFPFQTINFPKGTQQPVHSDLIHFDTMPRTLMAAAWVALEDMNEDNGPLVYYPKSHLWGTWDYDELGLGLKYQDLHQQDPQKVQEIYGTELVNAMKRGGLSPKIASDIKRGQTFIWAAGLAHGGSKQNNMELSRLSQVTHYYFEGAQYSWIPRLSDLTKGQIEYRSDFKPCTSSRFGDVQLNSCADHYIQQW
eukprot:CAMPEP_0178970824 /NCGR_PEP_ID=MMETSP0789-20121207/19831_1 /TAXON_ID=3005 /ORGANISM="Rhizosolenia setigera, Strain CCMP 1694" /LENGTH=391 /DNA_ID=CAMNT_0020657521 /DNA_START=42 /DNA_END=1214 /DNA_ORIENTATION=+